MIGGKEWEYSMDIIREFTCLVEKRITVNSFGILHYLHNGGSDLELNDDPNLKLSSRCL